VDGRGRRGGKRDEAVLRKILFSCLSESMLPRCLFDISLLPVPTCSSSYCSELFSSVDMVVLLHWLLVSRERRRGAGAVLLPYRGSDFRYSLSSSIHRSGAPFAICSLHGAALGTERCRYCCCRFTRGGWDGVLPAS